MVNTSYTYFRTMINDHYSVQNSRKYIKELKKKLFSSITTSTGTKMKEMTL